MGYFPQVYILFILKQGRFANISLPTRQDLEIICRGEMSLVWDWIINNTCHKSTIKKMKNSIKAYGSEKLNKKENSLNELKVLFF